MLIQGSAGAGGVDVGLVKSRCCLQNASIGRTGKKLEMFVRRALSNSRLPVLSFVLAGACCLAPVLSAQESEDGSVSFVQTVDMVSAIYEDENKQIIFSGKSGVFGTLALASAGGHTVAHIVKTGVKDDFLVIEKVANGGVLLGSSKGDIYSYQGDEVKKIASLSQYSEPVLDLDSNSDLIWASGGRGLVATSANGGGDWSAIEIGKVTQPALDVPSLEPGEWYLGVANIDAKSVIFDAQVNGRPAIIGEDFEIDMDEGRLIVINELDQGPVSISFEFQPGPPYRGGDVTWSAVIADEDVVTLAGEFGLILQSEDSGNHWIRRNGVITREEPSQPYWLCGAARNGRIILGGAAGKIHLSEDNGVTWKSVPIDSQEGVFGVAFIDDNTPLVVGAVGLLGIYRDGNWSMADRTALGLRSWIKNILTTGDDAWIVLGGRSTALSFVNNEWRKLSVAVSVRDMQ